MPTRDRSIDIRVDDQHIAGTLITPTTKLPGVLFVHGWGGSQQQYLARAHEIAALGCVCLTFDLRSHAKQEAHQEAVTREDGLRDVLAGYDAHRHADVERILASLADRGVLVADSAGWYLAR